MDIIPCRLLVLLLRILLLEIWDDQRTNCRYEFLDGELEGDLAGLTLRRSSVNVGMGSG
jgi:hypothetical protein